MGTKKELMVIEPFCDDRIGLVEEVGRLLERVHGASSSFVNGASVVNVTEERRGANDTLLSWSLGLDMKDFVVMAAICQAPLLYVGATDRGKTQLAKLGMNALFGKHGEGWWLAEISAGMTIEDFLDVDIKVLSESKLSEALSAVPWLAYPGRIYDEVNRAHPKVNNALLHCIDGSGLHLKANTYVPVGMPYIVNGTENRYSFSIVTSNPESAEYGGTYKQDRALERRIVLSIDMDDIHPTAQDLVELSRRRRPKIVLPPCTPMTESVVRVYESMPDTIDISPLATLFLLYLSGSGLGTCIRTRAGRMRVDLQPALCEKCHLGKAHRFCRHVGGLSEGLLLWVKEIASGITVVRAAKVLKQVRENCLADRKADVQAYLDSSAEGEDLYRAFRTRYIDELAVTGEDVVAAYSLIAPGHVYIDREWLGKQERYEKSEAVAFADIGTASWQMFQNILRNFSDLFSDLAANGELTPVRQSEVETLVTTVDCAMLSVIAALRDDNLPDQLREALARNQAA